MRAGRRARQRLLAGGRGRVVGVYRRAANLLFDDGALVGLLDDLPLHPCAVCAGPHVSRLVSDVSFTCEAGRLVAPGLELVVDTLEPVELRLRARLDSVPASCRAALAPLVAGDAEAPLFEPVIARAVAGEVEALCGALGVGEGLTPSGDDVLVGVLASLDLASAHERARLVAALAPLLPHATSRLSAELLDAACDGEYAEPLVELLDAVARQASLVRPAQAVLGLGHRSGRALMRGVVAGLELAAS